MVELVATRAASRQQVATIPERRFGVARVSFGARTDFSIESALGQIRTLAILLHSLRTLLAEPCESGSRATSPSSPCRGRRMGAPALSMSTTGEKLSW